MPEVPSVATHQRQAMAAEQASSTVGFLAVAGFAIAALYLGREVFVPMALAILLSFVLAPLVRLLQGWRLGRALPVFVVVLLAFAAIFSLGGIMASQVTQLAGNLPQYQATIRDKIATIRGAGGGGTLERAADVLQDLGKELDRSNAPGQANPRAPTAGRAAPGETKPIPVEVRQPDPGTLETVRSLLAPLIHPMATTGIVIIFVIFILMQREDLRNRLIRLAGSHDLQRTTAAIDDAARRLSRLLLTQVALNALFGFLIGVGLWIIGVPSAALWGMLAAVLRFVPYIGSFIAAVLPLILAAAVDPSWSMFFWTLALFLVLEPLAGHVIEPLVYGRSTGLSPVAVVVAATFWTWLWGPIGLVLATPLTVCLVVLGRHVERLEFLDVLLGDRPPLTAPETFYQRMLANDPGEAADQAEVYLKDRPLSSYYDDVALPGLVLAQRDATRGALDPARMGRMREALTELIDDLADQTDVTKVSASPPIELEPGAQTDSVDGSSAVDLEVLTPDGLAPQWGGKAPVLCIGARSAIDDAAAAMLAQLLDKHGLNARLEKAEALGTANVFDLELSNVAMICVSYLDGANPAHLRYTIRRLRRRAPTAKILVGCWSLVGNDAAALDLRAGVRADFVATTLRDAVATCLGAASLPQIAEPEQAKSEAA